MYAGGLGPRNGNYVGAEWMAGIGGAPEFLSDVSKCPLQFIAGVARKLMSEFPSSRSMPAQRDVANRLKCYHVYMPTFNLDES